MNQSELMNLCFCCLIDACCEHTLITLEEAEYTLKCWKDEGGELAEETAELSAEEFMEAWNKVLSILHLER